jgi:protein-S-isoprenylcysteine O-methyltransferase Ste14
MCNTADYLSVIRDVKGGSVMHLGYIIFFIFYGAYFTKMMLQRRKGIKTDQLGKGGKVYGNRTFESVLKFTTYLLAMLQLISVYIFDPKSIPISQLYAGLIISGIGTSIFIIAMYQMKDSWRAGIDRSTKTDLVTDGLYSLSRNPAFVGFDCLYIGFGIAYSNILIILFSLFTILLFHYQILQEEKYLSEVFGEEYIRYMKEVPRYLLFKSN